MAESKGLTASICLPAPTRYGAAYRQTARSMASATPPFNVFWVQAMKRHICSTASSGRGRDLGIARRRERITFFVSSDRGVSAIISLHTASFRTGAYAGRAPGSAFRSAATGMQGKEGVK